MSILTIFSNLIEKLFYNRLSSFIYKNNISHNNQFGFVKYKSTNTAIAHILSSLIFKCHNNKKIAHIILDLKKAFDLINHKLLLTKLAHYGIRGVPLKWLSDYIGSYPKN